MASKAYVASMTVAELKDELKQRGLSVKGSKRELKDRLEQAFDEEELDDPSSESEEGDIAITHSGFNFQVTSDSFLNEEDIRRNVEEEEEAGSPMIVSVELGDKDKLEVVNGASGGEEVGVNQAQPPGEMIVAIELPSTHDVEEGRAKAENGASPGEPEGRGEMLVQRSASPQEAEKDTDASREKAGEEVHEVAPTLTETPSPADQMEPQGSQEVVEQVKPVSEEPESEVHPQREERPVLADATQSEIPTPPTEEREAESPPKSTELPEHPEQPVGQVSSTSEYHESPAPESANDVSQPTQELDQEFPAEPPIQPEKPVEELVQPEKQVEQSVQPEEPAEQPKESTAAEELRVEQIEKSSTVDSELVEAEQVELVQPVDEKLPDVNDDQMEVEKESGPVESRASEERAEDTAMEADEGKVESAVEERREEEEEDMEVYVAEAEQLEAGPSGEAETTESTDRAEEHKLESKEVGEDAMEAAEVDGEAPRQGEESVESALQAPSQEEESVGLVRQVPSQEEEAVEPVRQVPSQEEEAVEPVQQVPSQEEEVVEPVRQVPSQEEEAVELDQEAPCQGEDVEPEPQVPSQEEEVVEPVRQVPSQEEEAVELGQATSQTDVEQRDASLEGPSGSGAQNESQADDTAEGPAASPPEERSAHEKKEESPVGDQEKGEEGERTVTPLDEDSIKDGPVATHSEVAGELQGGEEESPSRSDDEGLAREKDKLDKERSVREDGQVSQVDDHFLVHAEEDDISVFPTEAVTDAQGLGLTPASPLEQDALRKAKRRSSVGVGSDSGRNSDRSSSTKRHSADWGSDAQSSRVDRDSGGDPQEMRDVGEGEKETKRRRSSEVERKSEQPSIKRRRISAQAPSSSSTTSQERKRRWGSARQRSSSSGATAISSDVLKDIIPADVGVVEDEEPQQNPGTGAVRGEKEGEVMEVGTGEGGRPADKGKEGEDKTGLFLDEHEREWLAKETEREAKRKEAERARQEVDSRRKIEARIKARREVEEKRKEKEGQEKAVKCSPSPARNPPNWILHVENLTRPFTINQLKDLLTENGPMIPEGFWTDRVKSHCIVLYQNPEDAVATRRRVHGLKWPSTNPKLLRVDYLTPADVQKITGGELVVREESQERVGEGEEEVVEVEVEVSSQTGADSQETVTTTTATSSETLQATEEAAVPPPQSPRQAEGVERPKEVERPPQKKKEEEAKATHLLDELFRKTKTAPSVYWLPLTDAQVEQKYAEEKARAVEREKRRNERIKQRVEEEEKERKEREKKIREEREQRARASVRERSRSRSRSPRRRRRSPRRQTRSRSRERRRQ